VFLTVAAAFIVSGFFVANFALAAHTSSVTLDRTYVKGGTPGTYTFSITNNGADSLMAIYIDVPAGFAAPSSIVCPLSWLNGYIGSQVQCAWSPGKSTVSSGSTVNISFNTTSPTPGTDTVYPWTITTWDAAVSYSPTAPQTTVDVTPPTILSITTKDLVGGDGRVETATIVFSEPVNDSSFASGNFTIGGAPATDINTGATPNDNTFDVLVAGGVAGTEAKDVIYTQGTGADIVGNLLATATVGSVDGAAPVFMSAQTKTITSIDVIFSENVAAAQKGDFGVGANTEGNGIDSTGTAGNIVTLHLTNPIGTGDTPQVYYNSTWHGGVKDLALPVNVAATKDLPSIDGIKPNIVSTRTLTTTTIQVTFSEPMGAVDGTDFGVAGNTISSVTFSAPATTAILVLGTPIATDAIPEVTTIATPVNTKDNATVPNAIAHQHSTPTDGIAPTITATAPATDAFINTQTVSYTLSEAAVAGSGVIVFTRTSGTPDAADHTCVLQGTALNSGAHTLTLATETNACVSWANPLVSSAIYTVTFNASDAAGNLATAVTNTNVTFDNVIPTLTTVTIASNNANPTLAKANDMITLTIVASENLTAKPTITIATHVIGAGVIVQGIDAQHWTATYIIVNGDIEGTIPFTIDFTDIATNPGVQVIATTNVSSVTFDNTPPTAPTIGTFTATGGTVVPTYINSTNTGFTLTFTSPAANFAGIAHLYVGGVEFVTPITIAVDAPSTIYTLTGNGTSITQLGADGAKSLTVKIIDAAGNVSDASDVSNITKDTVVPTFASVALGADEYVNAAETAAGVNIVITTTGLEDGRTVSCTIGSVGPVTGLIASNTVTIASGALTALADGIITATCSVSDTAGNPAVNGTDTATKDVSAPAVPVISSIATDDKINNAEKAAIVVAGTAEAGSTVNVSLSDAGSAHTVIGSGTATGGNYSITIDGAALNEGTITPSVTATDAATNISTPATTPTALKDTIAPAFIINDDTAAGPVQSDTINLTVTEINPSISKYGFSTNDTCDAGDTIDTDFATGVGFAIAGNHTDYLCAKATDTVGNTTYQYVGRLNTDNINPTVIVSAPVTVTRANPATLTIAVTDVSPVTCTYQIDGGASAGIPCTGGPIAVTDGKHTFSVTATDGATNSGSGSITAVIDLNSNLTVGADKDFATIQEAVNNALTGNTITIDSDSYSEAVTINGINLTLTGSGGAVTANSFTLTNTTVSGSTNVTAPIVNINPGAKIQDGILLTSTGGTVNVAAGTYAESIIIDRGLSLLGAVGAIIAPAAGPGIQIDVSPALHPVTVDGFTITPQGSALDSAQGIVIGSIVSPVATYGITISNNTITTLGQNMGILVRGVGSNGPGYPNSSDLTVTHNNITLGGDSTAFYSSWVTPAHSNWSITYNTFDSPIGVNLQLHDVDGVTVDHNIFEQAGSGGSTSVFFVAELSNLTLPIIFSNNDVQGSGANLVAFRTDMNTGSVSNTMANVSVTGNTFNHWVVAGDRQALGIYPRVTNVTVHQNKFVFISGSTGLRNTSGVQVDATQNWWGDVSGPTHATLNPHGTGDAITDNVSFVPWYINDTLTGLDSIAPTATLTGTPATITNITTTDITVGGAGVVYYKYKLDGGAYGVETAIADHISLLGLGQGSHTVSIIGRDQAGNWQAEGSATTYTWTIDTGVPILSTVTIASNNSNTVLAKVGNTITLTFVANENLTANPVVTILGQTATIHAGVNAQQWTATYVAQSGDTEGVVPFTINFTDIATNPGVQVITKTGGSDVTFDKTAPTTSLGVSPATPNGTNDWYITSAPTITLTCADQVGLSGCGTKYYRWDGTGSYSTYSAPLTVSEGTHTLQYYSADNAGNSETPITSSAIKVDTTNPALVLGSLFTGQTLTGGRVYPINWTTSDANLGATPVKLEYSIDDGAGTWLTIVASTENDGSYSWSVPTGINSSTVEIKITTTDLAGNSISRVSSVFTIAYSSTSDTTPPVVTLNSPNGGESWAGGSSRVITWTATDDVTSAGSIAIKLEYSTNGSGSWTTIVASTENDGAYLWTVPDSATTNALIKVTATDAATNAGSDISNAVFTITAQPPANICTDAGGGNWTCNIALSTGWNLISLPVIISNTAIATVLSGIHNYTVQYYDNGTGLWKTYNDPAGVGDLTTMEDGKGYWINMTAPATLTVTGTKTPAAPDHTPTYSVLSGWNLIGFKSTISQLAATYLQTLTANSYTLLNASNENKNSGNMDSGKGYWLWMNTTGSIVTYSE